MNMIPEGQYTARAVHRDGEDGRHIARWGLSQGESKHQQVLIYFEVIEGEWKGTVLPWFGHFTKNAAKRTVEALRYCGFKGDDLFDLGNQPLDQQVTIVVEHNEYNEKVYPRVAFVNRFGGGTITFKQPMGESDVRKFAAMMKQSCAKVPEVEGERAASGNGVSDHHPNSPSGAFDDVPPPPGVDDDIPF